MRSPLPLCLALLFLLPAEGREEAAASSKPVMVRIYIPPMRGILTSESEFGGLPAKLESPNSPTPTRVSLYRNAYSDAIPLVANSPLILQNPETGEVFAKVDIPVDWKQALVVLDPGQRGDDGLVAAEVFQVDPGVLPTGWHTFLNQLPNPIRLTLNDETHTLEPGGRFSVKSKESRDRIFIEEVAEERGRRYTGAVYSRDGMGVLHIIRPDSASPRRIDVLMLLGPDPEE